MSGQGRVMPLLVELARYHEMYYGGEPRCFRCGWQPPVWTWEECGGWLQRAHVIDRWAGGRDHPENLRPLCIPCHREQPIFRPGDEAVALAWFSEAKP